MRRFVGALLLVGCGLQSAGTAPSDDASIGNDVTVFPGDATVDSGVDAPPVVDASVDAPTPVIDAAPDVKPPPDPGIECNGTYCDPKTQICCLTLTTGCTSKNGCVGVPVACDGKNDCAPNDVCCGSLTTGVSCRPSCGIDVRLCVPSANECTCTGQLGAYHFCQ